MPENNYSVQLGGANLGRLAAEERKICARHLRILIAGECDVEIRFAQIAREDLA